MSIRGEIEEEQRARERAIDNLRIADYEYRHGYLTPEGYDHYLSKVYPEWSDEYKDLKKSDDYRNVNPNYGD